MTNIFFKLSFLSLFIMSQGSSDVFCKMKRNKPNKQRFVNTRKKVSVISNNQESAQGVQLNDDFKKVLDDFHIPDSITDPYEKKILNMIYCFLTSLKEFHSLSISNNKSQQDLLLTKICGFAKKHIALGMMFSPNDYENVKNSKELLYEVVKSKISTCASFLGNIQSISYLGMKDKEFHFRVAIKIKNARDTYNCVVSVDKYDRILNIISGSMKVSDVLKVIN